MSDDFDAARFELATRGGVPLAVLYTAFRALHREGLRRWPRLVNGAALVLLLLFAGGVAAFVNAASSDDVTIKRTVERGSGVAVRDVKRGGLGWTFRTRM